MGEQEQAGHPIQEEPQAQPEPKGEETEQAKAPEEAPKTFTQDELNTIVQERLKRQESKLLEKLGIEAEAGIEEILTKSKGYDEAKSEAESIRAENKELKTRIAFIENSIDPAREDDVRTYFKGKELDLNGETLKEAMAAHPEWRKEQPKRTTISTLTPVKDQPKPEDEWDYTKRLFGLR